MNKFSIGKNQCGYLLEIPILFVLLILGLSVVLPNLTPLAQKITICVATAPLLFVLYYMIVIPGWMPSDKHRLKPPWNLLVFLLVAIIIIFFVIMIVFHNA